MVETAIDTMIDTAMITEIIGVGIHLESNADKDNLTDRLDNRSRPDDLRRGGYDGYDGYYGYDDGYGYPYPIEYCME